MQKVRCKPTSGAIRLTAYALSGVILIFSLASVWDTCRYIQFEKRAQHIRTGMSKQSVKEIMGEPHAIFEPSKEMIASAHTNWIAGLLTVQNETWAYGRMFDFRHAFSDEPPFFMPFRLRFLCPSSEDIQVEFCLSNVVKGVTYQRSSD